MTTILNLIKDLNLLKLDLIGYIDIKESDELKKVLKIV